MLILANRKKNKVTVYFYFFLYDDLIFKIKIM